MSKKKTAKKESAKKTTKKKSATKPAPKKRTAAPRESKENKQQRAARIYKELDRLYPDAHCELKHKDAFELLISTILSAQCTDVRVNMVTPALFKKYPTPKKMAAAPVETLEELVRTTGFYRNKAKSIKGASTKITEQHKGSVPDEMDELLELPGVARKTANVVLGNAFDKNIGVVVDTHVGRLSHRMGLTKEKDPKKVELDMMKLFEQDNWCQLSHRLIFHGRQVCSARKPDCENCTLAKECPKVGV